MQHMQNNNLMLSEMEKYELWPICGLLPGKSSGHASEWKHSLIVESVVCKQFLAMVHKILIGCNKLLMKAEASITKVRFDQLQFDQLSFNKTI